MTKNQKLILDALKSGQWMSAMEISEVTGISDNHVRSAMQTVFFKPLKKGIKDTGMNNGGRYVKVYKYVEPKQSNIEEALHLAKKYTGMFGQLHWAANNDKSIVLVD